MTATYVEYELQTTDKEGTPKGWRNLYLMVHNGAITTGAFLWDTKALAEEAAERRTRPETTEYLGAFEET